MNVFSVLSLVCLAVVYLLLLFTTPLDRLTGRQMSGIFLLLFAWIAFWFLGEVVVL